MAKANISVDVTVKDLPTFKKFLDDLKIAMDRFKVDHPDLFKEYFEGKLGELN